MEIPIKHSSIYNTILVQGLLKNQNSQASLFILSSPLTTCALLCSSGHQRGRWGEGLNLMQDVTILLETIALSGVSSILNDIYQFKDVYRFQLS